MTAFHYFARIVATCVTVAGGNAWAQTGAAGQQPAAGASRPAVAPSTGPADGARGSAGAPTTQAGSAPAPKPEELEQLVAPVALYPDSLLAQVLMASTYPLEVVQADRWVKQNPKLKDSADALNKLTWDPSVKSLAGFPQVLTMMSEKLDWTVKLGDAFLADQKGVMDAVQRLRNKAYAKGNLQTTDQQKVTVEPAAAGAGAAGSASQVIVVESANPSVMYVPTYNPTVVYGGWAYPAYPPYSYYPPGYAAGAAMVSFGVGMAVGAAWGHAWGGCNWHGGDVDIDVNRNVNVNQSIDRNAYKNQVNNRTGGTGGRGAWQHDASHRKGVAYRDTATSDRYRGSGAGQSTAQSRDAYRGRAEAGRQDLSRGGASDYRGGSSGRGSTGGYRTNSSTGRGSTASSRDYSGTRSSGFSGVDSSSSSARAASSRGQSSRSSSYSSSGGRSGGGGYSGGGSRGGGGGGGRGGGGGGGRR